MSRSGSHTTIKIKPAFHSNSVTYLLTAQRARVRGGFFCQKSKNLFFLEWAANSARDSATPPTKMRERRTEEAWCVHNDPCGLCCVCFTYGLIFFADYGVPFPAAANAVASARTHTLAHARSHPTRRGPVRQLWSSRCCYRGAASPPTSSCTRSHSSRSRCCRC